MQAVSQKVGQVFFKNRMFTHTLVRPSRRIRKPKRWGGGQTPGDAYKQTGPG